jgi:hypoxanthine phosphoribosyltransferase
VRAAGFAPDLVIGAAHGSIRPAILLSALLGSELFFVRYSMFKRSDGEPILTPADVQHLSRFRKKHVVLFDEDVAKGQTLRSFSERLGGLFAETRTAAVLRHYLAPYKPDFLGDVFYD